MLVMEKKTKKQKKKKKKKGNIFFIDPQKLSRYFESEKTNLE